MNYKNVLHIFTFALTFSLSVSLAFAVKGFIGLSTPEKITAVLTEDINNGIARTSFDGADDAYRAFRTEDYVSASESIDTVGLPDDFQAAWKTHMEAWRTHADYLNDKRFSRGYLSDHSQINSEQTDQINRSWYEVLRIARKYGATIPRRAYY